MAESNNGINIPVGYDTRGLVEGMAKIADSVNGLKQKAAPATSAFNELNKTFNQTVRDARAIGVALGTDSAAFKEATEKAAALKVKIDEVNNAVASQVGNTTQKAASGFNSLGNSINQITRELPAFTYSMQTGFMAISNNIPMLFDEITRIQTANKALAASGQPVQSTLSQLAGSFFTLGTAMSLGVTALTMFGPAFFEFIAGANDAKESADALAASIKKIEETEKDVYKVVQDTQKLRVEAMKEGFEKQKESARIAYKQGLADLFVARENQEIAEFTYQQRSALLYQIYQNKLTEIADKAQKDRVKKAAENETVRFELPTTELQGVSTTVNNNLDSMKAKLSEIKSVGVDAFVSIGGTFDRFAVALDEIGDKLGGWSNALAGVLVSVGQVMGQALVGTEDFSEGILKIIGGIAQQVGAALIAVGTAALVAEPFLGGKAFGAIAGGTALVAIGSAMGAHNSNTSFGRGGNTGNGQMMPQTSSSVGNNFNSGSMVMDVNGILRGNNVVLMLNNQNQSNRRVR